MGNPNRRVAIAKPVKPEPTEQAAPLPAPAVPCTGECGVRNWHPEDATWENVTDKKLPAIVTIKQAALGDAIKDRKFGAARGIQAWLEHFYSYHGAFDGSTPKQLPQVPEAPKPCKSLYCPVKNFHIAKSYVIDSDDCPLIVKKNAKNLAHVDPNSEDERTVASQEFLMAFWTVHGDSADKPFTPTVW
ncbi:MAG: hypothetical protein Q9168_005568 [Polycauliona sp. 1 TL-2023]